MLILQLHICILASPDDIFVVLQVGGLMVVGTLANRTPLSSSLLETLLNAMATIFQKESEVKGAPLLQLSLMVMIQLMQVSILKNFLQFDADFLRAVMLCFSLVVV